jgi:alginate O-acetyltransferase complex protein AlgI
MIFTSFEFIIFFILVLAGRGLLRDFSAAKWFLLGASYLFYMSWNISCVVLILLTSLLDFAVGSALAEMQDQRMRKLLLCCSLAANLGVLAFFKYTNFLLMNVQQGLAFAGFQPRSLHFDIILPAGISFFTFMSMSYTIDVYRREIPPCRNARDFLLFVAFFPHLVAGPIVRAANLLPQFYRPVRPTIGDVESGLAKFALGAVKKLVISDQIASHIDLIFSNPGNYDGLTLLQGALGYSVQIYCDFSGYSDMAIGCARMMGFRFIENFQMPYGAANITEFWRRWHISLSTWFRDYLYIPLGGNRTGPVRTYVNLMLTMLLCGLWHGASWNFVLWGGMHGIALAIHRLWGAWDPLASLRTRPLLHSLWTVISHFLTLSVALVGWIFFRASSLGLAVEYLGRMITWSHDGVRLLSPYILPAVAAVAITHLLINKDRNWDLEIVSRSIPVRATTYAALVLLLTMLAAADAVPFIYFQF